MRVILRRKLYSFINVAGLSISIASCLLVALYIRDEKSFDRFHANKDLIYRMEEKKFDIDNPGAADPYIRSAWLQAGLKQALKDELPEVSHATRFNSGYSNTVRYNDKVFNENLTYVDKDFFGMFSFRMISGDKDRIFLTKEEVILTPAIAAKYFGDEDPVGKTILIGSDKQKPFIVTGIIESPPTNSSLDFTMLVPQENRSNYEKLLTLWTDTNSPTFIQLVSGTDLQKLEGNLTKLMRKYQGDRLDRWEKSRKAATFPISADITMLKLDFTPLPDIHLKNETEWYKVSDRIYSYILGGIGVLILVISCINYIALALTTSTSRHKEVGVRKVVGAQIAQLIRQFTVESMVLVFTSMMIGVALVLLVLPSFNEFTQRNMNIDRSDLGWFTGITVALAVVVGVAAGSYPALLLSRFRPAAVLKGKPASKVQFGVTRPLVVLQFTLSAFLIISAVVMNEQMKFIASKDLGYDKEQVLVMNTQSGWNEGANRMVERFRNAAQQHGDILSVAGVSGSFGHGTWRHDFKYNDEAKTAFLYAVDPHYIETLGLGLVAGRNFDTSIASDTNAIIVNEAMVRALQWKDPVGEQLKWRRDDAGWGDRVVGVVKDYHFLPLEHEIQPVILSMNKRKVGYYDRMLVKISGDDIPAALANVQATWKEVASDKPFNYAFLDEDVARQYGSYRQWTDVMKLASTLAVVIACLGLFGLSGINAINRTREIGIRKVMGAGLGSIFILLNKQYIVLGAIAFAIAVPGAWYGVDKWLSGFTYHVTVSWVLFATCMFGGLGIAVATASYHGIKAAMKNPAETLRHE